MPLPEPVPTASLRAAWLRRVPILLILAAAAIGAFTLRDATSFDSLASHRETLLAFRDTFYPWSVLAFIAIYIAIVALSLPGGTIATLTGGFLFGLFPGVFYNVLAAGSGAIVIFLAARSGFGASLARRMQAAGGRAAQIEAGLRRNEWAVLFMTRLVPLVPFFVANLIPAFFGTSLRRFAVSTYLGIVPGALVFTAVGSGLGEVFEQGGTPDLGIIFSAPILLPLLGLAMLTALPMMLRGARRGF